jgi:hypothetical protein
MMGAWSDATNSSHYPGQFLDRSSLAELLEATQLRHLEVGIGDITVVIEENLYFAVAFQPGYGINANLFHPVLPSSAVVAAFSSTSSLIARIYKRCLLDLPLR